MDKKLISPVRRLDKPSIDIEIKPHRDDLINIKADIKIKNPITSLMNFIYRQNKKKG